MKILKMEFQNGDITKAKRLYWEIKGGDRDGQETVYPAYAERFEVDPAASVFVVAHVIAMNAKLEDERHNAGK